MASQRKVALPLILGLVLTLAVLGIASWARTATEPVSVNTGQHFIPPYGSVRDRFGFGSGSLSGYDVAQLNAGWYSNWGANLNPAHPDQLVYVQLIRFHAGADPHDPGQVTVNPGKATIARIAAAHPGSLWLLSNEPDSLYQGDPILPEVYAVVYHDYYEYLTELDPTALIANGGIVQPTPCRLEYLDIVWDTYMDTYGRPMPVDVWNIHAFILREVFNSWGASTPPGVDPSCGIDYTVDDADDIEILLGNIRAMRTWMKGKGYQNRPLIITEYGVLWPQWFAPEYTPARVSHFMTQTFDLFLHTTDVEIGYPGDGHRLVQAWAWYSLSDDQLYNGYIFNSTNKALSPMGETYAAYTAALSDTHYADLSARLVAARPTVIAATAQTATAGPLTFTLSLSGGVGNLGKLPETGALARFEILSGGDGGVIWDHDAYHSVPARFDGVVGLPPLTASLTVSGRHLLRLSMDPEGLIQEPREWNNVATTTLDLRPDLASLGMDYQLAGTLFQSGVLVLTTTVHNQGDWPSPAVSGTVSLETWPEGTLMEAQALSIPPLAIGAQAEGTNQFTWPALSQELYRVVLELDSDDLLPEQDEDNNGNELLLPVVVSTTLNPTGTSVLTSVSGAVQLIFPAGAVSAPTKVFYTPLWPGDWETGKLKTSRVAFSLTMVLDDQPAPLAFARPVTLSWRYRDADVAELEQVDHTRLFVLGVGNVWYEGACLPYQRDPDQNTLVAALCQKGRFVFGNRYDAFLPLVRRQEMSESANEGPERSPLLLPGP